MKILALETTGDLCSAAVAEAGTLLAERLFRHRMQLSQRLISIVESTLLDAGMTLQQVEGLAVGIGPGSFTGVRIGVTTVKTWADALRVPLAGISTLDALAEQQAAIPGYELAAVIRGRPGAVYSQLFRAVDESWTPLGEPALKTVAEFVQEARPRKRLILCGDGVATHADMIAAEIPGAILGPREAPRASAVAALALRRLQAGDSDDPFALTPLYIAGPPIDPRAESLARPAAAE